MRCEGGILGLVVSDRFLRPESERLRRWQLDGFQVFELNKQCEGVFTEVARAAVIILVSKRSTAISVEFHTLSFISRARDI